MRKRLQYRFTILCAIVAALGVPWLALQEARRQAFDAAAELTLGHARDILHRADETSRQADATLSALAAAGHAPCSPPELALMRHLNLSHPYIQGVGRVRGGVITCSSMGTAAFDLGAATFTTPNRVVIYSRIPLDANGSSPLFALERDGFAVLVHRALPLATWTPIPQMALGLFQVDRPPGSGPELARGAVSRAWLSKLNGSARQAVFADATHLVAVARSTQFRIAAVAAVPAAYVEERTDALAIRIVPAGAIAGLAVATAILLLARRQRSLAAELRHALRNEEFFLQYQPIVALASGRCIGAEALLRWRRAPGDLIGPDLFIPVAEESGLITQLTERVLQLVERDAGSFLAQHPGFHVAINFSAADLHSPGMVARLERFIATTRAAPGNLLIEITERGFLDMTAACATIAALRSRGFEVAIDDFGTGYSSLAYLDSLELDILKIDRSFVEAIGTAAPTNQVVPHIIAMARSLNLDMIAEGVERPAQAEFLKEQGVQYAQGWLFGRPASFAEVCRMFREHGTPDAVRNSITV
jgi:sensor c-di-GMP phosphodiesterase-like protein